MFNSSSDIIDNLQKQPINDPDEKELWHSFKTGNKLAFSLLYKKYYFKLYNYGFHLVADKHLVKDCLHDLFLHLWKKKESIVHPKSIKSYLFTAFKRKLIDAARENKRFSNSDNNMEFEITVSFEHELIAEQTNAESIQKLQTVINSLTKRQREVIFLRYFENLSYNEIAVIMKSDVNSIYVLMSRAIESLRDSYCLTTFYIWVLNL